MAETTQDIIAEMRGNEFDDPHLDADGMIGARRLARDWADRYEAARERERRQYERLHECFWEKGTIQNVVRQMRDDADDLRRAFPKASEVLDYFSAALSKSAENVNSAKVADTSVNKFDAAAFDEAVSRPSGWDAVADPVAEIRRMRGDAPPCNAAATREALANLIPVAVHGYSTRAWLLTTSHEDENSINLKQLRRITEDAAKALENARAALSAPPRNCDRFADEDDAFAAWHDSLNDGDIVSVRNAFRWLFAPAEGGAE